jgi:chromosome segregation ATPase
MPGKPMTEEQKQALRERLAAARAAKAAKRSRSQEAIEHVATGMMRGELEEIETAIDKRESKLSRLQTDEDVANRRVVTANAELQKVNARVLDARKKLEDQLRMSESAQKSLVNRIGEVRKEFEDIQSAASAARTRLDSINAEISERVAYKEKQEKDIEAVVESGNDRLYEVDQEVKEELRKRDTLHLETTELEQRRSELEKSCAIEESKIEQLKLRYEQTVEKYRENLMVARAAVAEEQAKIAHLEATAKQVTDELVTKGKAALARENAIASREAELVSRERLLKSRESRYS